jgi:hypothetical protein
MGTLLGNDPRYIVNRSETENIAWNAGDRRGMEVIKGDLRIENKNGHKAKQEIKTAIKVNTEIKMTTAVNTHLERPGDYWQRWGGR